MRLSTKRWLPLRSSEREEDNDEEEEEEEEEGSPDRARTRAICRKKEEGEGLDSSSFHYRPSFQFP